MNHQIFREYDIRGIVDKDFNLADVEKIGAAYGTYLHKNNGKTAVIGRDCRLSSDDIRNALVKGLLESGVEITDVGVCPTPLVYFAQRHLGTDGGVMITASHNPPEYNGFKVLLGNETICGEQIQEFRKIVESDDYYSGRGTVKEFDIVAPYTDFITSNIKLERPIKLAVDAGNATGGVIAGPILRKLGCEVEELFFEMDGTFPNHEPDPTVLENLKDLRATVVNNGLELGIGFDGDTDRVGVVDEKGQAIYGDMLLLIFAREILAEHPGSTFIAEVKCSQNLYDDIEKRGGKAVMWRAGHSLIKKKLKEEKALLGGEMSGHIFFSHRFFGHDDAIYAACRFLEIVSRRKEPVSEYLTDLPVTYNTPEIRVDCPDDKKFKLVEMVKNEFKKKYDTIDVDGVRIVFPDGWGLLRASNTGPVLVLRYEAYNLEKLQEIQSIVEETLERLKKEI